MRAIAIALTCLTACAAPLALAGGQNQVPTADLAVEHFWKEVYGGGGTSLYCGTVFSAGSGLVTASRVYGTKQIKSALRCNTERQCSLMSPQYPFMLADLHNLYPALTRVDLTRGNAQFGELDDSVASKLADIGCDLKATFQLVEPRDQAKGNIARALLYMHVEYDLPLHAQVQLLKAWHRLDPVDIEEHQRNDRIAVIQGTRNRFIDDPALVEQLPED